MRVAPADAHAARARAALVIGNAWRIAGDDARAQPWYQRARCDSADEGDVSLVSILLHNLAAFRAGRISLDDAFDRADAAEAQRVLLEAESTGNYDAGVGNDKLMAEMPLMRAQLMTVLGRYDAAIALIDAQLPRARAEGQGRREARFLADAAYAEVKLGRLDEANKRLRADPGGAAADDRGTTTSPRRMRAWPSSRALGRASRRIAHAAQADGGAGAAPRRAAARAGPGRAERPSAFAEPEAPASAVQLSTVMLRRRRYWSTTGSADTAVECPVSSSLGLSAGFSAAALAGGFVISSSTPT